MDYKLVEFPATCLETIEFVENGVVGKRTVLPGGVRVLTEQVPGQHSVSVAFWIGAGSRDEAPGHEGSTHFLEHLLFKGTKTRSAQDISKLGDYLGGAMNASTARNYTNYYGRVFSSDLPQLVDLLADMVTSATLDTHEMENEQGVILEELAAGDDRSGKKVMETLLPLVIGQHSLARSIGGTPETVKAITVEQVREHYQQYYIPQELIVSAAGDVVHEQLCELVVQALEKYGWVLTPGALPALPRRGAEIVYGMGGKEIVKHPSRQSVVAVGMPGFASDDDEVNDVLTILDYVLGGGSSSRLFQEVREERGLAYSVGTFEMSWNEGGVFGFSAGCAPENATEVAQVMTDTFTKLADEGITEEELEIAFNQCRARKVFSAETNGYRRNRLGYAELFDGKLRSVSQALQGSREVTAEQVQELAQRLLTGPLSVVHSECDN